MGPRGRANVAASVLYCAVSPKNDYQPDSAPGHRQTFHMGMLTSAKRIFITPLAVPGVGRLLRPAIDSTVSLFMMHRFDSPDLRVSGHPPQALARGLAYL